MTVNIKIIRFSLFNKIKFSALNFNLIVSRYLLISTPDQKLKLLDRIALSYIDCTRYTKRKLLNEFKF